MMRLVLAGLLASAPALAADERPLLQPTRDVAVTYRLEGAAAEVLPGGAGGSLRLQWEAAGQRLRLDAEGRPQSMIVDLGRRQALLLDTGLRSYVTLPVGNAEMAAITLAGAQMTRRGPDTVAGLPCTNWSVTSQRGGGTLCMTSEGVMLRAVGEVDGKRGGFTAVDVLWGPQAPGKFQVPAGYMSFAMPGMGRK